MTQIAYNEIDGLVGSRISLTGHQFFFNQFTLFALDIVLELEKSADKGGICVGLEELNEQLLLDGPIGLGEMRDNVRGDAEGECHEQPLEVRRDPKNQVPPGIIRSSSVAWLAC